MGKHGVVLRGNGTVSISSNYIIDCIVTGVLVAIPNSVDSEAQPTVLADNFLSGSRTNCQLSSGEVILRRNYISRGDTGIVVSSDFTAVFEGNVVYDNSRCGVILGSKTCTFSGNQFYTANETGAFECTNDVHVALPRDNSIFNHCATKQNPPPCDGPERLQDMNDLFRGKDITAALQAALLQMHQCELPSKGICGCSAIPGSEERRSAAPEDPPPQTPLTVEKRRGSNLQRAVTAVRAMQGFEPRPTPVPPSSARRPSARPGK
jgi:hypothetical protein